MGGTALNIRLNLDGTDSIQSIGGLEIKSLSKLRNLQ